MRDIYELFQTEIVDKINCIVEVKNVTPLTNGSQNITLCNNKWLRVNQYLTDLNGFAWLVTNISNEEIITVKKPSGATDIVYLQKLTVKQPKFLFGSMTTANNEYLLRGLDNRQKLPLIWLVENITEKEYGRESSIERDSNFRVYLLDDNNPNQMLADDFRNEVVYPMIALKDEVVKAIQKNRIFKRYDSIDTRPFTRFGNENEKGVFQNILDDNLSGVELKINLSIYKDKKCIC